MGSLSLSGLEPQPAAIQNDENATSFPSPGKQTGKSKSVRFGFFGRSRSNTFDDDQEASPAPSPLCRSIDAVRVGGRKVELFVSANFGSPSPREDFGEVLSGDNGKEKITSPQFQPAGIVSRKQNATFEQDAMSPRTSRQQKMRANIEKRKNHIKVTREQKESEQERAAAKARTVGDSNSQSMRARLKRVLPSRKSKRLVAASGVSAGVNSISSEETSLREC